MAEAKISTVPGVKTPPLPDPWYVTMAKKTYGPTGATYTTAAGVEAKTFLGWTNTSILGIKSEQVFGGTVSTVMGGVLRTSLCADWNVQRGLKKDTSWGNKKEWRKGEISLRCIGKKEDFVFSKGELTNLGPGDKFDLAKRNRTNLAADNVTNLANATRIGTVNSAIAQIHDEFSKIREISTSTLKLNATASAKIAAAKLDIGAVKSLSLKGASISIAAPSVDVKGKVSLGGIAVPNLATAAQLAKLKAKLAAQELAITALKAKGQALRVRSLSLMLPT